MESKYVLIVEFKQDDALVLEQYIEGANSENIYKRQAEFIKRSDVSGVCIAKLDYESGKKSLLK